MEEDRMVEFELCKKIEELEIEPKVVRATDYPAWGSDKWQYLKWKEWSYLDNEDFFKGFDREKMIKWIEEFEASFQYTDDYRELWKQNPAIMKNKRKSLIKKGLIKPKTKEEKKEKIVITEESLLKELRENEEKK
jgi:hypothetical protein